MAGKQLSKAAIIQYMAGQQLLQAAVNIIWLANRTCNSSCETVHGRPAAVGRHKPAAVKQQHSKNAMWKASSCQQQSQIAQHERATAADTLCQAAHNVGCGRSLKAAKKTRMLSFACQAARCYCQHHAHQAAGRYTSHAASKHYRSKHRPGLPMVQLHHSLEEAAHEPLRVICC